MSLNSRFHHRTSLAVCDRASNSASVLEVVTVRCLVERQSIGPPNSLNRYPSVLYLVTGSSAKAASLAEMNDCCVSGAENSIAIVCVPLRYDITRSAASWCCCDGLVRNSESLLIALAASGRVIVVAYSRD